MLKCLGNLTLTVFVNVKAVYLKRKKKHNPTVVFHSIKTVGAATL